MKVGNVVVRRNEIGQRLGIGYRRVIQLLASLKIEPIIGGRQPLYSWPAIEAALGVKQAEPSAVHVDFAPEPKKEPTRHVGGAFVLTENEYDHFTRAATEAGGTRMSLLKTLLLDYLTKNKAEKSNGLCHESYFPLAK